MPGVAEWQLGAAAKQQELRAAMAMSKDIGIDDIGCDRSHAILQMRRMSRRNGRFYHETEGEDCIGLYANTLRITWIDRKSIDLRFEEENARAIMLPVRATWGA